MFFFILYLCVGVASALRASDGCEVPVRSGHLHLTSLHRQNMVQDCSFNIEHLDVYVEVERHSGRYADDGAWMNITWLGDPHTQVSIGMNQIWIFDTHVSVSTTTRLESSMWIHARVEDNTLTIEICPPGSSSFGSIFNGPYTGNLNMHIKASTTSGMEQVIRDIRNDPPTFETAIHQKSIAALEKRILQMEKEIESIREQNKRHDRLHKRHSIKHSRRMDRYDLLDKSFDLTNQQTKDMQSQMINVQQSIFMWTILTVCVILVGLFISWRMYQRHKKDIRWRL